VSVKRASSDPSSVRHRPAVMWIGVLTLLLSLFTPMITLEVADAAAAAAERAQGSPPDCEDGYEPNAEGTECVPIGQGDLQPECDPGTTYNEQSGQCEPEQPQCDPGTLYNEQTGLCEPEQPTCDPGFVYNEQSGQCEPEQQPVSIQLYKWECDAEASQYLQDYNYLDTNCYQPQAPYDFWHGGPDGQDGPVGIQGFWEWTDLTPGQHWIGEQPSEQYVFSVWCTVYDPNSGPSQPQQYTPDQNGQVHLDIPSGWIATCYWFNIDTDGGNTVTVYKWDCVEGTEYGRELDYYLGNLPDQETGPCETEHLNIPISLIHGGPQQDTTTQANGTQFEDIVLNNGSFQIAIDEPDGYGDPMVWCWPVDGDPPTTPISAPGGVFTITPGSEPFSWQCLVYDIPWEGNTVTVYKWQCVEGTEYGRELAYYEGGLPDQETGPCETEHLNIPISLIHGGPQQDTTTQANGTQFDNVILTNGSFQIAIDEPDGYGDPMVWCWPVDGDPPATPIAAPGGTFTVTPGSEPFSWQCLVYDIPEYEGEYHLELYKLLCGPTVDRNLGLPDLGTQCTPAQGISFTATFGDQPPTAYYTDANGHIDWPDAPGGQWWLEETSVPGWGAPKVYCGPPQTTETPEVTVTNWTVTGTLDAANPHIICTWINFEEPYENGRITVYKYQCPPQTTGTDFDVLQETCTTPHNGVNFTLEWPAGSVSASTVGGTVDWLNLDQGTYTVREELWPGYGQPLVWCGYVVQDGAEIDPTQWQFDSYPVTDGAIQLDLNNFPARIVCYWYNFPPDYGEITIYKWLCPPGYDIDAWGADPAVDCTEAWNGVTFTLDQPEGVDLVSDTGDSIPGAVYFGGLNPGAYRVTETVPPDIEYVFVLECTGTDIPKVHQYPLSWGNKLDINVAGGDSIVCHWYNVPEPEDGWITVYKYQCWTSKFTSKVDCEIYEHGATFELYGLPGNTSYGTGTTNNGGLYTWNGLPEGAYTIDEISHKPCKITSTKVDGAGNAWVDAGEGTIIKVYNCKSSSITTPTPGTTPTPKTPGKVPGKYPNTGIDPEAVDNLMPSLQENPVGTPPPPVNEAPEDDYYRVSCLEETGDATATATEETEASPTVTATEEEFDLAIDAEDLSTPEGTPGAEEDCARGALPERVVIEAANVDAGVETLEIVDGIMEQPTGPTLVTWYKETGRLGEANNVVIAGHLNWWNVPEGVFYRLQDLQQGDRVEITGDDGQIYVYEVEWVRQESNLEPPAADVIGPTDTPSLTLITCGGPWNADIAEYEERTVARAVQVEVMPAEADSAIGPSLLAA